MGTDAVGRGVYSRLLYAARIDLFVATVAVAIAVFFGVVVGAVTGYLGGWPDSAVMRFLDGMNAFPPLILAMAVAAAVGPSLVFVISVIAVLNVSIYARIVRSEMRSRRILPYAEASRATGNSELRTMFRHVLPECLDPVWAQAALNAGWAILAVAALSFIGLGVPIPTPEWGSMVADGAGQMQLGRWWIALFPGLAIVAAVLGFNLLGDALTDALDPSQRQTRTL